MLRIPASTDAAQLAGWTLVSLRPVGGHAGLRRAAQACGARLLALSPLRLVPLETDALDAALAADRVVFTSPAAVRHADRRRPLRGLPFAGIAVGAGTARALRRAGVARVQSPGRMDSEGLLALPVLADVAGRTVGMVTAPGGRGLIARTLEERGARVLRAEVYRREAMAPPASAVRRLMALDPAHLALALTSGEALAAALRLLPAEAAERLRRARVVAASGRLHALARGSGFPHVLEAAGPRPQALLAALAASARTGFR
ncbi:uroporphyrinogen-III synthase [Coralloluteibacterium thermophilus]|uniref:Uroporphyrinogen-III synthase n=1 Tax=Coralloluteibacterium thermophilum TaxID=2707049 RepID=A0ABV9NL08_9GAMM